MYVPAIEAVSLLNGTTWGAYASASETQLTSSAHFGSGTLANDTMYYVYATLSAGVLTYDVSTTAPDAPLTWKTGATGTHRYLFCFKTSSADNDCDGLVDEGTDGYDDDGDDVSEIEGDCNDYNQAALPGAPESPDGVDNDCDGTVDEGTSLYDNDGDGYAGVNNDCDDTDPLVNPSAEELCDGIDNDCDGLKDSADGCIASSSAPLLIGELRPSQNACEEGARISIEAKVFDAYEAH